MPGSFRVREFGNPALSVTCLRMPRLRLGAKLQEKMIPQAPWNFLHNIKETRAGAQTNTTRPCHSRRLPSRQMLNLKWSKAFLGRPSVDSNIGWTQCPAARNCSSCGATAPSFCDWGSHVHVLAACMLCNASLDSKPTTYESRVRTQRNTLRIFKVRQEAPR